MFDLRYWDDPVLSTVCEPVRDSEFGSKLEDFGRELISTMGAYKGVGLAAPQVGVTSRVFTMLIRKKDNKLEIDPPPLVVCNPTLELGGAPRYMDEGCLSLPEIFGQVVRSEKITMRYFTPSGIEKEIELTEMEARVGQHEADHLNGIMFINRLASRQMRRSVLRKWEENREEYIQLQHGKTGQTYIA